jgi:hypothetical protein
VDQFEFSLVPGQLIMLLHNSKELLRFLGWSLVDLNLGTEEYKAALTVAGSGLRLSFWQWEHRENEQRFETS